LPELSFDVCKVEYGKGRVDDYKVIEKRREKVVRIYAEMSEENRKLTH